MQCASCKWCPKTGITNGKNRSHVPATFMGMATAAGKSHGIMPPLLLTAIWISSSTHTFFLLLLSNYPYIWGALAVVLSTIRLGFLLLTLNDISAWLDTFGSKAKSKKFFSVAQLRPFWDDQKKVQGFLDELENCKSTASLVLSPAIRYVHELA